MNKQELEIIKRKVGNLGEEILEKLKKAPKKPLMIGGLVLVLGTAIAITKEEVDSNENVKQEQKKETDEKEQQIINIRNNQVDSDFQDRLEKGKPLIIKVEPTGYTYAEIYKTIDYIKELATSYDINCPILFDIEKLMDSSTIRANCLLAEEFCNKLTANGIYVGLYGNETSMQEFETQFAEVTGTHSMDLYDKLITYKGKEPTYNGNFNMQQQQGKSIEFKYDLMKIISQNDLNAPEKFISDQNYIIEPGENLSSIASSVSMKTSDLAEYNNITDINNIVAGQKLLIPNQYQNEILQKDTTKESIDQENTPSETTSRLVKGIDVSEHQGDINWEKVKGEVDFAIIRLCDFYFQQEDGTCKLDEKFYQNIEACEKLNIPVGIYYYSHATTSKEAIIEANFVAEQLKGYSLELPVYMDIETPEQNRLIDSDSQQMKEVITAAMTQLEGEGYYAGVYCNGGVETNVARKSFINSISKAYNCWLTSSNTYNVAVNFSLFKEENYNISLMPTDNIAMYQYCQKGKVVGIAGDVDLNYASQNLMKTIQTKGYSKIKTN